MARRRIYDSEGHAHFVTFSCYKRRKYLADSKTRQAVISVLASQLKIQNGSCIGFVVMPDHVHALVWFPEKEQISHFMKQWKQRSSINMKRIISSVFKEYSHDIDVSDPIWQARYYGFNVFSEKKVLEKLSYMHNNPVKAGLVAQPCDWMHSTARYWEMGRSVGLKIGLE